MCLERQLASFGIQRSSMWSGLTSGVSADHSTASLLRLSLLTRKLIYFTIKYICIILKTRCNYQTLKCLVFSMLNFPLYRTVIVDYFLRYAEKCTNLNVVAIILECNLRYFWDFLRVAALFLNRTFHMIGNYKVVLPMKYKIPPPSTSNRDNTFKKWLNIC